MKERTLPTSLNCFIGCPYQLQCGVAIRNNFLSCKDQIYSTIPNASRLQDIPLHEVGVFDSIGNMLATISRGLIVEN